MKKTGEEIGELDAPPQMSTYIKHRYPLSPLCYHSSNIKSTYPALSLSIYLANLAMLVTIMTVAQIVVQAINAAMGGLKVDDMPTAVK